MRDFLYLRQLNLLSFGEEAAEFEPPADEAKKTKMKSTYDFMENAVPTPADLIEELKREPEPKPEAVVEKATIDEKLKEKVKQAHEEKKKKKAMEEKEEQVEKAAATPSEERSSAIEKLKQDIRNISKVPEEEPVKKKEKKKSLVELEREKYAANQKKKKRVTDKEDDSDVSLTLYVEN